MTMFDKFAPLQFGGWYEQQEDSTHVCSMWHIPNGTDYDKAMIMYVFFSSEKDALGFAAQWDAPPEMAVVMTLQEYLDIKARVAEIDRIESRLTREYKELEEDIAAGRVTFTVTRRDIQ
jgi:hypothetical protein